MLRRAASWKEKSRQPELRATLMRRTSFVLKAINTDCGDETDQADKCVMNEHTGVVHTLPVIASSSVSLNTGEKKAVETQDIPKNCTMISSSNSKIIQKCKLQADVDVHKPVTGWKEGDDSGTEYFSPCSPPELASRALLPSAHTPHNVNQKGIIRMAEQLSLAEEICEVECDIEQYTELGSDVSSYNGESFLMEALGEELLTVAHSEPQLHCHKSLPPSAGSEEGLESPFMTVRKYRTLTQLARQKIRPPLPMVKSEESIVRTLEKEEKNKNRETLFQEVNSQKVLMLQCSKALGICKSTREFNASVEHVEAERGLLLASHRCRAALEEIERVQQVKKEYKGIVEQGSITISDIFLSLKKDFLKITNSDDCAFWFVCLASQGKHVFATRTTQKHQDGRLKFEDFLQFVDLPRDFVITIQVYSLRLRQVTLPYEERYHLDQRQHICPVPFKIPRRDTQQEFSPYMKLVKTVPIRTPSFNLIGSLHLHLTDLHVPVAWRLDQVPLSSPLTGDISLMFKGSLNLEVEHSGFLSMMEDSGLWQRRWCYLSGHMVSYWNYPHDQQLKDPIGKIDLRLSASDSVKPVDRSLCARPRTLLLEIGRTSKSGEKTSTIKMNKSQITTIRYLWQADSAEELSQWCAKLTDVVSALKMWNINCV